MDEQKFNSLVKEGYNRIPLMREVLADLDTPLKYLSQAGQRALFLPVRIGTGRGEMGSLFHYRSALPEGDQDLWSRSPAVAG